MIIINPGNRPSIFQRIFPHTPALLGKCFLQSVFHIWDLHFKLRSWRYWSDETWRGLKVLSPKFGIEWSQNRHKLSHTMWPMKPSWYLKHMSRSSKRASMMKMWNWLLNQCHLVSDSRETEKVCYCKKKRDPLHDLNDNWFFNKILEICQIY